MSKVWLITGASGGFGRAIAEAAVERGETVVPTARDVDTISDFAEALPLDVHSATSVEAAVRHTIDRHGRVDVLVNNAGHGCIGALEEVTDEDLRGVLETNVLGVLRTTRAVLPFMRARRGGHVVQLSSVGGVVANPGHGAYATSKFALEGMSEALAGEVAPWGIRVSIVEPGPFRTEFAGRSMRYATPVADYADTPAGLLRARFTDQHGRQPNDPAAAARLILAAVYDPATPLRLPLGPEAIQRIRGKLGEQLSDLEAYAATGADTRFAE